MTEEQNKKDEDEGKESGPTALWRLSKWADDRKKDRMSERTNERTGVFRPQGVLGAEGTAAEWKAWVQSCASASQRAAR